MNLSEDTIKHLEKKAFLRGLEEAKELLGWPVTSTACTYKLDDVIEKLQEELEGQQYDGGLNFPAGS
jgi:hypothetical protein